MLCTTTEHGIQQGRWTSEIVSSAVVWLEKELDARAEIRQTSTRNGREIKSGESIELKSIGSVNRKQPRHDLSSSADTTQFPKDTKQHTSTIRIEINWKLFNVSLLFLLYMKNSLGQFKLIHGQHWAK